RVRGMSATPSLFRLLQIQPALGRIFTEDEGHVGHADKVMLSDALWQQMFGRDPDVVGKPLHFAGGSVEIGGVIRKGFQFFNPDVLFWVPAAFTPAQRADNTRLASGWYNVGRLKPGATIAQVKAQIEALDKANLERFPQYRSILINSGYY